MIKIPASYSTELSGSGSAISPPHELRQRVKMRLNGFLARRFKFVTDDHPTIPRCIIQVNCTVCHTHRKGIRGAEIQLLPFRTLAQGGGGW